MIKKISVLCVGFVALIGCQTGSSHRPIVRNPGANYEADLAECQQFSQQRKYLNADTGVRTAVGAGAGAVVGGLIGKSVGGGAAAGAALGAGAGLVRGMMDTKDEKKQIINKCLMEKGYNVYL